MEDLQSACYVFYTDTATPAAGGGSGAASDSGSPGSPVSDTPSTSYSMAAASLLQGRPIGGPYATATAMGTSTVTPGFTSLSPDMTAFTALQPSALTAATGSYMFSPQSMAAAAALGAGGKLASPPATALTQPASKPPHQCPNHFLCTVSLYCSSQHRALLQAAFNNHLPLSNSSKYF